jgi:drug/metabolite transporter (DMT)-like permease
MVSRHTLGSLLVAACALTWGAIGIIVRELDLPPLVIVFFRVAIAGCAVTAGLLLARRGDLLRGLRPGLLVLGALLALHWGLYFAAIKQTSVASAVLVTYAGPIFMAGLAALVLGERITRTVVVALAVSVGGIVAITLSGGSGSGEVRAAGVALALGAAVTYAFLIVALKRQTAGTHPVTIVVFQMLGASLCLLPAALLADWHAGATEWGYLALLGIGLTACTGVVYVAAIRWVPVTTAGMLSYMEPVSAAVLAAVLLGEPLTAGVVAGGMVLVGAGVAVALQGGEIAPPVEEPVPPMPAARTPSPALRD